MATQLVSRPCFGMDARHDGGAQLFHCLPNGFAPAFLKGTVQRPGIGAKRRLATACLLRSSFDSLKQDPRVLFSVNIEITVINNAATP